MNAKEALLLVSLLAGYVEAVELPHHDPLFEGMIVRCEQSGKCHWECEFGVVTSTTMVNENLIVKPVGCVSNTPKSTEGSLRKSYPNLNFDDKYILTPN